MSGDTSARFPDGSSSRKNSPTSRRSRATRWSGRSADPTGSIRWDLPYDGARCFPRAASDDAAEAVKKATRYEDEGADVLATMGHLVFVDHDDSNLSTVLGLDGKFGAHALRLPVRTSVLDAGALVADTRVANFETTYEPAAGKPSVSPIRVDVQLHDPGHMDEKFVLHSDMERMRESNGAVIVEAIREAGEFIPELTMTVEVHLTLPARSGHGKQPDPPMVRRVRVHLPGDIPLPASSVTLTLPAVKDEREGEHEGKARGKSEIHSDRGADSDIDSDADGHRDAGGHAEADGAAGNLQIDTRAGTLDWRDVPMTRPDDGEGPRRYTSGQMNVRFDRPGELFAEKRMHVDVEVELPGELLSGMDVRYFDAFGNREKRSAVLTARSWISTRATVMLWDAFADRSVAPFQSFSFDEIVPDQLRVADVRAALIDQHFTVLDLPRSRGEAKKRTRDLVVAERDDGASRIRLWVYVDGRKHLTRRESRHHWGHRYTSKMDSGTIQIYVRGVVRGDTKSLMRAMNGLHLALRDRFRRLTAHR